MLQLESGVAAMRQRLSAIAPTPAEEEGWEGGGWPTLTRPAEPPPARSWTKTSQRKTSWGPGVGAGPLERSWTKTSQQRKMSWGPGVCDSDGPQRSFKLKAELKAAPAPASAGGGGGGGGDGGAWRVTRGAGSSRGGVSGGPPAHTWSTTLSRMGWRPGASTAGGTSKGEIAAALRLLKAERSATAAAGAAPASGTSRAASNWASAREISQPSGSRSSSRRGAFLTSAGSLASAVSVLGRSLSEGSRAAPTPKAR